MNAPTLDVENLLAIDVHTHAEVSNSGSGSLSAELEAASSKYFKVEGEHRKPTLDEIGAYYRRLRMAAVVFTVDAEAATGVPAVPNEEIAEAARRYPDAIIPFASIDPAKGRAGARRVRDLVERHGVRGFKFHPNVQAFYPNDRAAYPLYEAIEECGAIAVFHTGQTGIGAGARAAAGSGSSTRTRCTSTTSPPTSPACRSSWLTPRSRGRTRRSRWPRTSRRCTST